tara:strand:- start:51 stop:434 length:384 start_codon:yes stop_codon:yes gene_type:complete
MAKENPKSVVAFPAKEIKRILEDNSSSKGIAASYIKFYAPEVELDEWEGSQMPFLTDVYSYCHQLCDFLDRKLNDPTEAELAVAEQHGTGNVMFTIDEIMMLTGVVKAIEKSRSILKMNYNISFEVH